MKENKKLLDGWEIPAIKQKNKTNDSYNPLSKLKEVIYKKDEKGLDNLIEKHGENGDKFLLNNTDMYNGCIELLFEQYSYNEKIAKKIVDNFLTDVQYKDVFLRAVTYSQIKNKEEIINYILDNIAAKDNTYIRNYINTYFENGDDENIILLSSFLKKTNKNKKRATMMLSAAIRLQSEKILDIFLNEHGEDISYSLEKYLNNGANWESKNIEKCGFLSEMHGNGKLKNHLDSIFAKGIKIRCKDYTTHDCHDMISFMLLHGSEILSEMVKTQKGMGILNKKLNSKNIFSIINNAQNIKKTINAILKLASFYPKIVDYKDKNNNNIFMHIVNFSTLSKTIEKMADISTDAMHIKSNSGRAVFDMLNDANKMIVNKKEMQNKIDKSEKPKSSRKF